MSRRLAAAARRRAAALRRPQSTAAAQGQLEAGVAERRRDLPRRLVRRPVRVARATAGYGDFDPHLQQGKNQASYGIQSRLTVRALVVARPTAASKLALVKTDLYIPQDMLLAPRRAAARGQGHRDRPREPDDDRQPQPLVAVLLVDGVGRVGVPGRLRRALLRLRSRGGSPRRSSRPNDAPRAGARQRADRAHRQAAPQLDGPGDRPTTARPPATRTPTPSTSSPSCASTTSSARRAAAARDARSTTPGTRSSSRATTSSRPTTSAPLERFVDRETGATTIFTQNAVGHRRARALDVPRRPRAPRVHPPPVRAGRGRARGCSPTPSLGTWRAIGAQRRPAARRSSRG